MAAVNISADALKEDQIKEITSTKFLVKSRLLRIMPSTEECISGITVVGSTVLVVRHTSQVYVYKSDDFTFVSALKITGAQQLEGLVSCSHYNCLYAIDPLQKIIYRYDLANNVTTKWSVGERCCRLSLSKCYNVLATLCDAKRIHEYNTEGGLVKEVNLDSSIDNPWHCVQLSTGNYVVSHAGMHQHRVCIVDGSGRIIQSFGRSPGSGVGQLLSPCYLAINMHDKLLVVNGDNNRVLLFSRALTYLGDISILEHEFNDSYTLHFDELNHRLYIGETRMGGARMFLLDIHIDDDKNEIK